MKEADRFPGRSAIERVADVINRNGMSTFGSAVVAEGLPQSSDADVRQLPPARNAHTLKVCKSHALPRAAAAADGGPVRPGFATLRGKAIGGDIPTGAAGD